MSSGPLIGLRVPYWAETARGGGVNTGSSSLGVSLAFSDYRPTSKLVSLPSAHYISVFIGFLYGLAPVN